MSRAGQIRLTNEQLRLRIVRTVMALVIDQERHATRYSIAKAMNYTPSSWLRKKLEAMVADGQLTVISAPNKRGQNVSYYDIVRTAHQLCELPWKCNEICVENGNLNVCIGKAFIDAK